MTRRLILTLKTNGTIVETITNSKITHFTNRLMQCRQNTVVSLMGSIQHCIFCTVCTLAGFFTNLQAIISCSNGTTYAKRDVRNNHEYLTRIKKSGKNLQYSNMRIKVVDLACTISSIIAITSITKNNANTNNIWERKLDKIKSLRNYNTNKIHYLFVCNFSFIYAYNFMYKLN